MLLVIQPSKSHRRLVLRANDELTRMKVNVIGAVINRVETEEKSSNHEFRSGYGYGLGYEDGYGEEEYLDEDQFFDDEEDEDEDEFITHTESTETDVEETQSDESSRPVAIPPIRRAA